MSREEWENKIECRYVEAIINTDDLKYRIEELLQNLEWYDRIYLSNELNGIVTKYENKL